MITAKDLLRLKTNPKSALLAVVDELSLANEGLNGFINLVLERGDGKSKTVTLPREGIACLLDPLLKQYEDAHALLDEARKNIYPPR